MISTKFQMPLLFILKVYFLWIYRQKGAKKGINCPPSIIIIILSILLNSNNQKEKRGRPPSSQQCQWSLPSAQVNPCFEVNLAISSSLQNHRINDDDQLEWVACGEHQLRKCGREARRSPRFCQVGYNVTMSQCHNVTKWEQRGHIIEITHFHRKILLPKLHW